VDFDALAMEFLRALRGQRSQVAWSRRLGYRSNVAYAWEHGRRWPTAAETFRACARSGVDVREGWRRFFGTVTPDWIDRLDPTTTRGVSGLLDEVRGNARINELAALAGISRYSVSRWLSGRTEPRLPDFMRFFEAASTRLLDLLSELVDMDQLPSVAPIWERIETRRQGVAMHPWTQAILRALELVDYRALPAHEPGWIARHLGIDEAEEARCLAFLRETDQVAWTGTHFEGRTVAVDTRSRPVIGRTVKSHWTREGARRIEQGAPGQFSYLVFSVSREDFERIREHHLRYFNTLRGIISESTPNEVVSVANVQLFGLEGDG